MPLVRHLQGLWGNWWFLPLLPPIFLAILYVAGGVRPEHVIVIIILTALAAGNAWTKKMILAGVPAILILLGYEAVQYLRPFFVTPGRIVGCGMRDLEASLFGIDGFTPSSFFATHHNAFFDVFFAIPYTFFWMIAVVYGVVLFFRNRPRLSHYLWLLALAHAVAFVLWMALPTAPPWYIAAHGCLIDPNAAPSPAALVRVDQLFGITYFDGFYSRDPTVFGAFPSLHCAFPAAGLVASWRRVGWLQRSVHLGYLLWMLVASVYLGHHWLLDGLTAIAVVLVADALVVRFAPRLFGDDLAVMPRLASS